MNFKYQVAMSREASKYLKRQDTTSKSRIETAINGLPLSGDIKKLQGKGGFFRLRVGNFRKIFE